MVDSPSVTFKRLPQIGRLQDSLSCSICYELYTGPVSLNCGHSFCSACIRTNFDFKGAKNMPKVCPICRAPSEPGHIRVSVSLREATATFQKLLPSVLDLIKALEAAEQRPSPIKQPGLFTHSPCQQQLQGNSSLRAGGVDAGDQACGWGGHEVEAAPRSGLNSRSRSTLKASPHEERSQSGHAAGPSTGHYAEAPGPALQLHPTSEPAGLHYHDPAAPPSRRRSPRNSAALEGGGEVAAVHADGSEDCCDLVTESGSDNSDDWPSEMGPSSSGDGDYADLCTDEGGSDHSGPETVVQRQKRARLETSCPAGAVGSRAGPEAGMQDQGAGPSCASADSRLCIQQKPPHPSKSPRLPPGYCSCPVCGITIRQAFLNNHIDTCLLRQSHLDERKGQEAGPSVGSKRGLPSAQLPPAAPKQPSSGTTAPSKPAPKVEIPPKLVFNLLKDKDLKAKLVAVRLPIDGKRQDWIDRYLAYSSFLQSKVDEGTAQSTGQLRANFLLQRRQYLEAKKKAHKVPKDMAQAVTSVGHSHEDLIAKTRQRMQANRKVAGASAGSPQTSDARGREEQPGEMADHTPLRDLAVSAHQLAPLVMHHPVAKQSAPVAADAQPMPEACLVQRGDAAAAGAARAVPPGMGASTSGRQASGPANSGPHAYMDASTKCRLRDGVDFGGGDARCQISCPEAAALKGRVPAAEDWNATEAAGQLDPHMNMCEDFEMTDSDDFVCQ